MQREKHRPERRTYPCQQATVGLFRDLAQEPEDAAQRLNDYHSETRLFNKEFDAGIQKIEIVVRRHMNAETLGNGKE